MKDQQVGGLVPVEFHQKGHASRLVVPDAVQAGEADIIHVPSVEQQARVQAEVSGSFESRGREFRDKAVPLSFVTGVCALTVAGVVGGWVAGLLTLAFFVTFAATYLTVFIIHTFISVEGIELINVLLTHQHIKRAEQARLERYRKETEHR